MIEFVVSCVVGVTTSVFWLAFTAFMIWMIVDCALHEPRVGNERLIWVIITVFVPYVGAIVYYLFRRPERIRAIGS
jgi:Phospholipase_D-nuclease N-terminal